ncbi:hypothetical protein OQJ13_12415 [Legionella sp. PATHC035]|uniref:hypothetical protein n=1 Tax=Legionella sp. PATHC035 TaxID=2992040 RepID=UPI001A3343C7|nr:hypothetical protein [Legionella sp. PATHC035]HAU0770870.1 hypothetical protein [Legionella pneumophila]MCW8409773.1 hypothetical protein [Legionella sp. PATHC035]HAU0870459.1 hypothetical protein [Legionella pneumophila]HAU0888889.1 hypothetical protein [Legionella pneumophila]HCD9491455.1 hypothetical protein [Legionella pneumophila]
MNYKELINKYSNDHAEEDGYYLPISEDDDGMLEPDWEGRRWFRRGEPFPDNRDWILAIHLKM